MEKKIVIINGNGGVGKDTFVSFCARHKNVKKCSTVDKIKEAAKVLGWNNAMKSEVDRKFLADLKTLSTNYNDFPFTCLKNAIEEFKNDDNEVLFLFIREIDEIKRMKEYISCKTLLITNSNTKFIDSNEADKNVLNYEYDYVVENSLDEKELDNKAQEFLKSLFN